VLVVRVEGRDRRAEASVSSRRARPTATRRRECDHHAHDEHPDAGRPHGELEGPPSARPRNAAAAAPTGSRARVGQLIATLEVAVFPQPSYGEDARRFAAVLARTSDPTEIRACKTRLARRHDSLLTTSDRAPLVSRRRISVATNAEAAWSVPTQRVTSGCRLLCQELARQSAAIPLAG